MLVTTVAAAVVTSVVVVGSGEPTPPPSVDAALTTPATVAVRPSDLPSGLRPCAYSGDMDAYLGTIRARQPAFYEGAAATWSRMQAKGAVSGYAAFFARDDEACDNLIRPQAQRQFGDEEEHIRNHPRMVLSSSSSSPTRARRRRPTRPTPSGNRT